ncbi:hypothetical protein GCK32_005605, partial [Trichostrongylus colubriformis]
LGCHGKLLLSNPSTQPTLVTALSSRANSVSTVSTGRDPLTNEVRLLREALDGFELAGRARAGNSPLPRGDETIPDSFTMPDEVHGHDRDRFHFTSLQSDEWPRFQPFKLKSTVDDSQPLLDIDSVPHLGKRDEARKAAFDGAAVRTTIHGPPEEDSDHLVKQRKTDCKKRGRPVVIGRSLYSRGRVHFRPHLRHQVLRKSSADSPSAEGGGAVCDRHDAAVMTEEPDTQNRLDGKGPDVDAHDQILRDEDSPPVRRKSAHKKEPFVGSGLKAADTFSIAGNQQQVMKATSTRFQEWLPLVRSIIYDSRCKNCAQALQRDLSRQKRSHSEQMRLLQQDLDECRTESERREVRDDIARLKQQWTSKHDRVLFNLNEHISKGGVWSKVQQLRTIYSALVA